MLLTVTYICFAIFPSILTQNAYYRIVDHMVNADKDRIRQLAHELVVEVNYKIHQIDDIRNQVSSLNGFEIGMLMGQIKEKYKSMLEIYRQTRNKYSGASKIVMPGAEPMLPIHYFVSFPEQMTLAELVWFYIRHLPVITQNYNFIKRI